MSDNLKWELVKEEHIIQDAWIDFRRNIYRLPNGAEIGPVYNYSKHSFVVIVAKTKDGKYICVKQYRHGIDKVTTEFPAGGIEYIEKSDVPYITKENTIASEEDALAAAKRELMEETGYVSESIKHLITMPANATLATNNMHIYLATGCEKKSSQHLDDTEFLNVILLTEDEIREKIFRGDFLQSHHVLAWYMAKDLG